MRAVGLGSARSARRPPSSLSLSVTTSHTWQWTPFAFLVILASLSSLPPDIFEAARIDRASSVPALLRYITLPLIWPALITSVIMRMMVALSAFAAIFAATGGGPGTATEILNLYTYRTSFTDIELRLRSGSGDGAARGHTISVVFEMFRIEDGAMNQRKRCRYGGSDRRCRRIPQRYGTFPVLWALLTSFKSERDVLAYPPKFDLYTNAELTIEDVLFGRD